MKTIFLRVLEADDKAESLRAAIREPASALGKQRFEVDAASFAAVPRSSFAYWVSERIRGLFSSLPAFAADGRVAVSGGKTLDDFRWIRASWEVIPKSSSEWVGFAKGGAFSPFYADVHLLLDWRDDARSLKEYLVFYRSSRGWSPNWTAELHGSNHYLRPGLTWPRRTNGLSLRAMPAGCIFADKGPAAFVENDNDNELLTLAAIANSRPFALLVSLQLARTELAQSFEVGVIQRTPIPNLNQTDRSTLARLAHRIWALKRGLDTQTETSHAFMLPALLSVEGDTVAARASAFAEQVGKIKSEIAEIQGQVDVRCFDLYGIDEADQRAIAQGFGVETIELSDADADDSDGDADGDEDDDSGDDADAVSLAVELLSWLVGVTFGRFDVRLATGKRPLPAVPKPFDPLPACSPAMLTGDDGLPLAIPPTGYPIAFPENGLLVDDPGHARDLTAAVRTVFDVIFDESDDAWWNDIEALLDPKGHDLRAWLAASFFEHHLKHHSKSRRKAPIVWQLAVPSGRYSVWLYAHRLNRDSFIQIQNDLVAPKLGHEEHHLSSLKQSAGANPSSKESKEIETQEAFVEELRDLLDKVKRVAPLWHPTLDDGVVLTMAPLWRLVPQHKPWQKELKSKWEDLVAGKYDWAHLAMHLWPERVIPKCAEDRSLAIAHGLEEVFWFEDEEGKWKPYKKPQKSIDDLVSERTSTAVKAALKSLLDAPEPASGAKRSRKVKAA